MIEVFSVPEVVLAFVLTERNEGVRGEFRFKHAQDLVHLICGSGCQKFLNINNFKRRIFLVNDTGFFRSSTLLGEVGFSFSEHTFLVTGRKKKNAIVYSLGSKQNLAFLLIDKNNFEILINITFHTFFVRKFENRHTFPRRNH